MTTVGEPVVGRVHLRRGAVVALWRRLRLGDRPALLDLPDHGATLAERDAADREALAELHHRGLDDDLADALAVLARPEVDVDLRCWDPDPRGWFAAAAGELAVVVSPGDDGWTLDVGPRPAGGLVRALALRVLARLPDEPPAPGAFDAPAAAFFGDARPPVAAALKVTTLRAAPPKRRIQLGAGVHEGGHRRRIGPVTVVDAGPGRMIVEVDGGTVRVRPGDRAGIVGNLLREPGVRGPTLP
ncbi:ESX secretion-associated protein EspG [Actinomycetospora atypica]|uniref:ESX secretion-associated protein EspG n=1 Tax=Actinomycetospora atypica TaxID=1290095 RepID=A0ABV9YST0_9PSEU